MSENGTFKPVIVGFLCNWCSYRAADLAGTSRMGYPATLRDIRIMCTGRLDPTFVLRALEKGADGVLIMGCHPGQCHYQEGNYKAIRRFALLKRTLRQMGVEEERVQLHWASAAEGVHVCRNGGARDRTDHRPGAAGLAAQLAERRPVCGGGGRP